MSRALIGRNKPLCVLLAVQCGRKKKLGNDVIGSPEAENGNCSEPTADRPAYLVSGGQLEVQFVDRPIVNELKQRLESSRPDIVFFLSDKGPGQETWPLVLGEKDLSIDTLKLLFGAKLPDLVYFEASTTARLANLLHSQGVKHVVGWKDVVGLQIAEHFRQALLAALRSSGCESWDAFVLANASLEMHCSQFRISQAVSSSNLPVIIGDPPAALVDPPKEGNDDGSPTSAPLIQIFDEETELRLLVCAEACSTNDKPLEMVEAGLAALLAIEVRRIKLIHRISAPPPPSAAATFARGVVTMRCDLCTSSSARISLVVSGSAQTCFADQFLESTIRKELMEKSQLLRLVTAVNDSKPVELRRSVSIACGAAVLELKFKVPNWAAQTMRQLSTDATYKSLVALGIAGIEGSPVASFQKDDAERLASLNVDKSRAATSAAAADSHRNGICEMPIVPPWFAPAAPTRKRQNLCLSSSASNKAQTSKSGSVFLAAMKPIPHATRRKLMPFAGVVSAGAQDKWSMKLNGNTKSSSSAATTTATTTTTSTAPPAATATAAAAHHNNHNHNHHNHHHPRSTAHAFPIVLPEVKKHNCNRPPILECPEEEFLSDVVQFLVSRGHGRLIPPTGIDSFPDVVLNGKRLDLYNLYREVVSRGGFRVGNGINWKGQIFSKMRNHTTTNRMTGVGNTLKKHYETYLLEYELAHEDVDGECCILCHSSAEGDWVNCGICGEWAHFGCDRRSGLATFKEYAKTDGLEYICPRCSVGGRGGGGGGGGGGGSGGGGRKKQRVVANEGLSNSFPVGKRS